MNLVARPRLKYTDDPLKDLLWHRAQQASNSSFMSDGEILLNRALNRLYYKDQTGVIQEVYGDQLQQADTEKTALRTIRTAITSAGLTSTSTTAQVVTVLNTIALALAGV